MSEIADDLMFDGDINSALRRLMQSGFDMDGERTQGTVMLNELVNNKNVLATYASVEYMTKYRKVSITLLILKDNH